MSFSFPAARLSCRRTFVLLQCLALCLAVFCLTPAVRAADETAQSAQPAAKSETGANVQSAPRTEAKAAATSGTRTETKSSSEAKTDKKPDTKAEKQSEATSNDKDGGKADNASGEDGGAGRLTEAQAEAIAKESLRKEAEKTRIEAEKAADTETKRKEAEELSQNDLLDDIWTSQRTRINAIIEESTHLSEEFLKNAGSLEQLRPVEQDIRRLLIMVKEFNQWPSALEAVNRRLGISGELANSLAIAAAAPQVNARNLLERLNNSVDNLDDMLVAHHDETEEYLTKINTARFMLTAIIARYTSVLAPTRALVERVNDTRADISKQLPGLWLKYYTSGPVQWLTLSQWESVPHNLSYFTMGLSLRQYVEIPLTTVQWQSAITRFLVVLLLASALLMLTANHALQSRPELSTHIKRYSLPWNILGIALLAAAYTTNLEFYKLFMALGNLFLIFGQITLGWDLRRVKHSDVTVPRSPLLSLMPPTLIAYLLLYMPLPQLLTHVVWLLFLIGTIAWQRRHSKKPLDIGKMNLERSIIDLQPMILWPCLIVCILGYHFYSMAIYLLYSSLSIATELSVAAMSIISRANESLDQNDGRSMLSSFLLALAAPFVLLLTFGALSLWLATLPGGLDMLQFYIFKSVSIGETQLNFVQVLFIATAFFLARTAARMGRNIIAALPEQSTKIDPSLITPLQTTYYYLVWFIFVLFVLRSLGMNLSNLAVIAGGLSVGIGFGMQTIVNNFISGILLIFSRTLQVGDIVEVGSIVGRIKKITVRATVVETYDSAIIYVPNSAFVSGNLTNWTSNSRSCRQHVFVSVAYGSDTQKVVKTLLSIAEKHQDTLAYPKPSVQFLNFGDSNLDFRLTFWVKDYDMGAGISSDIRFAINERFNEEGIEIAYPTMDLNVQKKKAASAARNTSLSAQAVVGRKIRRVLPRHAMRTQKPARG